MLIKYQARNLRKPYLTNKSNGKRTLVRSEEGYQRRKKEIGTEYKRASIKKGKDLGVKAEAVGSEAAAWAKGTGDFHGS